MPKLPFKIGADPEFTFVNNNTRYSALEIITKFCKNRKNFNADGKHLGYHIDEAGTLGWDGHDSSGEIRPKESDDPKEVTKNIGLLLAEAHKCIPTAEIKTTSLWMSIGGHIHLEGRDYEKKSQKHQKILQRALASLALPLLANENPINVEIRREKGAGYGDILDARTNGVTYEFRTLTAEWITTPEICNATLAYLGVIWNEIYNHPERIEEFAEIIAKTDQQIRALQEIIIDEYGALTDGLMNRIKKHVRKFELYEQFKSECEFIFDIKKIKEIKEKYEFDVVRGWKFQEKINGTQIPKIKELLNEKMTQEKLKDINLDEVINYVQIFWTNERNMEKVARKIGDTVIAWEWNLKNRYFLIALPKGIPSAIIMNGKNEFLSGIEMVKTQADHAKVKEIMTIAKTHFERKEEFKRTSINLKQGKTETDEQRSVIIGIPYKTREENEGLKEILTLIHQHENNALKNVILENAKDMDLPIEHPEFKEGYIITMMKTTGMNQPEKHPKEHQAENTETAQRTIADRTINTGVETVTQEMLAMAEMDALTEEIETLEEIVTN
jgi:hypothetical protein